MEISFGGCGFLGVYHIGVGKCFEDNARHLLKRFKGFYGASAGSICAAAAACRCDSMVAYKWVKKTVEASRVYRMGLLNPRFDLYTRLRAFLESYLPKDAHKRARGKVRISMTTFPDMKNYVVSDFTTRKELINAIICSSFIPGYAGFKNLPRFRGKLVCDGGFSSNIPFAKDPNVITVSPFSGGCDICPQGESPVVMVVHPVDQPLQLSTENLSRLLNSLNPSSWDYLEKLFHQGYQDSLRFLIGEGHIKPGVPYSRRCSRDIQPTEVPSVDTGVDTAEAESEYFSVDGGDFLPVEKHSRSQSFALSNGGEFLSCLDEEEVRSQCSDDEDTYELYQGHGVDEEELAEPPAPEKTWLSWTTHCLSAPITYPGNKVVNLVTSLMDHSPHPLEKSWDGDHSTPAFLHAILTHWPSSMAAF